MRIAKSNTPITYLVNDHGQRERDNKEMITDVFELDEAKISKVRDGEMSRFHGNNELNKLHRL